MSFDNEASNRDNDAVLDSIDRPLSFDWVRDCIRAATWHGAREDEMQARVDRFNEQLTDFEKQAWDRGWRVACDISQAERERWAEMLLQVSAAMRGKDRADGYITTSIYPDPDVYDWYPEGHILDYRERPRGGSK